MIKGAIFDLDGTLLDTLESIAKSGNEMLKTFGYPPVEPKQYGYFAGNGADVLVERALRYRGESEETVLSEAKRVYRECFGKFCRYRVQPYEGVLQALSQLKEAGIFLGVLTNKPHPNAVALVNEYFPAHTFTHVIGQQENFPRKPDPKGIFSITHSWGILPEECAYFGDSDVDMKTGKRAGCVTVGVLWGFREKEELLTNGADFLISNPLEIASFGKGGIL